MKKLLALLMIFTCAASGIFAQDNMQVQNLATFARVWGFLKYYHPAVAKGSPDWDAELIKMIPEVMSLKTQGDFEHAITAWYYTLPKAKLAAKCTQIQIDTVTRIFNEKDIKHLIIPVKLKQEFTRLYLYHIPDSNKYFSNVYNGHQLDYIYHNENPYSEPTYPDEPHRLLALFRYWNIITYFYPHKKQNAPHWDDVLPLFIPKFMAAANADEYRQTFLMLTTRLKDSHSFFSQKEWDVSHNQLNPPFTTYYIRGKYFIGESKYDSLMKQLDLKIGDEIISMNNKPVSERIAELKPYTTGTNELSFYRNIGNNLFKIDTNRNVKFGLMRQGKLLRKAVQLYTWPELNKYGKVHPVKLWQDFGHGIWYVRPCEIVNPDTLKVLFAAIHNAKTVIWDMRAYPSFKVAQIIAAGLFENMPESTISYNGMLFYPGAFNKHPEKAYTAVQSVNFPIYKGRLLVLVNEHTQSLAESVAYELRLRPNTIIMGRQTAGTTGNILFVDYPGGIEASFTGVKVEGLNDSFSEGKGVKVDKEIKLSGQKLSKYPDYMLEMAYQEALNGTE